MYKFSGLWKWHGETKRRKKIIANTWQTFRLTGNESLKALSHVPNPTVDVTNHNKAPSYSRGAHQKQGRILIIDGFLMNKMA